MKTFVTTLVLSALSIGLFPAPAKAEDKKIDAETYAAIAYSPKTGRYGYAWNQATREGAEKAALTEVKEDDAKSLTWVQNGFAALALSSDNAYGFDTSYGEGATEGEAIERSIKQLRKYSTEKITTILLVCSGDVKPRIINLTLVK